MDEILKRLREELLARYRLTTDRALANALWEVADAIEVTLDRTPHED